MVIGNSTTRVLKMGAGCRRNSHGEFLKRKPRNFPTVQKLLSITDYYTTFAQIILTLQTGRIGISHRLHRCPTFEAAEPVFRSRQAPTEWTSFDRTRDRLVERLSQTPVFSTSVSAVETSSFKNTRIRHPMAIRGMRFYKEIGYIDQSLFKSSCLLL